jgi:DNA-binding MarR family transcriptional regulator
MNYQENEETIPFYKVFKKASLLMSGNERSVLGILIDDQQMNRKTECEISISYICKNLNITDKTTQKIIKRLIELEFITKKSGYSLRKKNTYSVSFEKIEACNRMSSDELFAMRDNDKKNIPVKTEVAVEIVEQSQAKEDIHSMKDNKVNQQEQLFVATEVITPVQIVNSLNKIDEKELIEEFEQFINDPESKIPLLYRLRDIMPNKYASPTERKVIIEYVNGGQFSRWGIKNDITKYLS